MGTLTYVDSILSFVHRILSSMSYLPLLTSFHISNHAIVLTSTNQNVFLNIGIAIALFCVHLSCSPVDCYIFVPTTWSYHSSPAGRIPVPSLINSVKYKIALRPQNYIVIISIINNIKLAPCILLTVASDPKFGKREIHLPPQMILQRYIYERKIIPRCMQCRKIHGVGGLHSGVGGARGAWTFKTTSSIAIVGIIVHTTASFCDGQTYIVILCLLLIACCRSGRSANHCPPYLSRGEQEHEPGCGRGIVVWPPSSSSSFRLLHWHGFLCTKRHVYHLLRPLMFVFLPSQHCFALTAMIATMSMIVPPPDDDDS